MAGLNVLLDADDDGLVDDGSVTADGSGNCTFTGVPLAYGVNLLQARIIDGGGTATVAGRMITRLDTAPSIKPEADRVLMLNSTLAVPLVATDVDGDTLTYSFDTGPTGATVDAATGAPAWTPTTSGEVGTHTFTVSVADETTPPRTAATTFSVQVVEPSDVGPVDFLEINGVNASTGDLWYLFRTSRAGYLTVDATDQGTGETVALALYDAARTEPPLVQSGLVDGFQRIDRQAAAAGETYYLKVSGTATDVDLRIANLVNRETTALTVNDTAGDDHLTTNATQATLARTNGTRTLYEANDFDTVHAYHSEGTDTHESTAATDYVLDLVGDWTPTPSQPLAANILPLADQNAESWLKRTYVAPK